MGYSKNVPENLLTIEAAIETIEKENVERLVDTLSTLPGARSVRIHT
jgi:hypothetical protein